MNALRRTVVLLIAVVAVAITDTPAASAEPLSCAAMDVITIRTMTVEFKPPGKSVAIGSVAKVPVHVTRPAGEDPLQQGIPLDPPASAPADGVTVGIGLTIKNVFAPGYAVTNQDGKATVSIRIPRYAPAASVDLDAYAYNVLGQTPCYTIQEDGYTHKDDVFKTTR